MRVFKKGEYVHIPAGSVAYRLNDTGAVTSFFKAAEPLALMYLGHRRVPEFADSNICDVFYEGKVYSVIEANVYEMGGRDE